MPLPTPHSGETQDHFISRCMGDSTMRSEYPKQEQRSGVCYQLWRSSRKMETPTRQDFQRDERG